MHPQAAPRRPLGRAALGAAGSALMLLLSACSSSAGADVRPGTMSVVASTSAWGDVARDVGGRWVTVTSVISDPDQDPHSFEGSARVLLAVKDADLVIENGGGYDYFMDQMIRSADTSAPVIDAVAVSGRAASAGPDLNEHVWYDLPTARRMAYAIAADLSRLIPAHAADFAANARQFAAAVGRLVEDEHRFGAVHRGEGVAITEPVPLYLLQAMGLRNLTPPEFTRAIEEGGDVAARTIAETLDLFKRGQVAALVYNSQTSSPITEQVKRAAVSAGVPVVAVTETMPVGATYLSWMHRNLTAVARAVSRE